jgi:hypothetical protein
MHRNWDTLISALVACSVISNKKGSLRIAEHRP